MQHRQGRASEGTRVGCRGGRKLHLSPRGRRRAGRGTQPFRMRKRKKGKPLGLAGRTQRTGPGDSPGARGSARCDVPLSQERTSGRGRGWPLSVVFAFAQRGERASGIKVMFKAGYSHIIIESRHRLVRGNFEFLSSRKVQLSKEWGETAIGYKPCGETSLSDTF